MSKFHSTSYTHVESVTLKVRDLKQMQLFYENVLGLNVLKSEDNKVTLGIDSPIVTLVFNSDVTPKEKTTGLYHFAVLLPSRKDLSLFLRHLIKVRYPLTGGSDHGVSEALYFNDPEGNGIEVYQDHDESQWPKEDGHITMYTEILDYESLLALTKEIDVFTKMPKGTILGHLHLHVRNISEAESFFTNILKFQPVLKYGPSALFISDKGYHHHIGLNTWNGTAIKDRTTQTGLLSYAIKVPENLWEPILDALNFNNIAFEILDGEVLLEDINKTTINLIKS